MFIDYNISYICDDCVVLVIEFESEQYTGSEPSRSVEVVVIISGGSSAISININVTIRTSGQSAQREEYH